MIEHDLVRSRWGCLHRSASTILVRSRRYGPTALLAAADAGTLTRYIRHKPRTMFSALQSSTPETLMLQTAQSHLMSPGQDA